jgi:hypothetical protein
VRRLVGLFDGGSRWVRCHGTAVDRRALYVGATAVLEIFRLPAMLDGGPVSWLRKRVERGVAGREVPLGRDGSGGTESGCVTDMLVWWAGGDVAWSDIEWVPRGGKTATSLSSELR